MANIKKNFFYSSILTTANYIFPLIIFPYITRVLGVSKVGLCDFVDSIINYYCIFSMLGLTTVAVREIAGNKNDKAKMSKAFSSLLSLNVITTAIMIAALIVSIFLVPRFLENKQLMVVGIFKLLSKAFLIEWLYTGLEDFKYITVRSVIVRCIYVISVLVFVREEKDYVVYYALTTMTFVVNAVINTYYSKRFVKFSLSGVSFKPYWKPVLTLGVYAILTSMYTTFNVSYLGFVGGDEQVGYYSTATKLHGIILALFTAFTGVMLPRMSSLLSEGNSDLFKSYIRKSIGILLAFAMPTMILCIIYADQIIRIIAGPGYEMAVPCMQIVMPLVFVVGYEQILVLQILTPLKRDTDILTNSIIGAVVGVLANIIIVPRLVSVGSAIVWVISEMTVMIMAQYFVGRLIGPIFPKKIFARYISLYLPIVVVLYFLHLWQQLGVYNLIIGCAVVGLWFVVVEIWILKDDVALDLIKRVREKMSNSFPS